MVVGGPSETSAPTAGVKEERLGPQAHRRLSVLLLRNVPEHSSRSMERFPDELARHLRQRANVRVDETTIHASALARSGWGRRLDRQASLLVRYPIHVRRQSADVFHIVDHSYAHLIRSLPRGNVMVTCHDLMMLHAEREDIGFRGSSLRVRWFRRSASFLRRAGLVACDSEATADDVVELVGVERSRVRVIPLGVNGVFAERPERQRIDTRRRVDPTGKRIIVMHVSTGLAYKNIPSTLHVLAALQSRGIDAMLVRVGIRLGPRDLALARALGLVDRIREFHGIPDAELADLYSSADVLLFPSRWEGFGWPPLEALACGTPSVVASECRSVVDLVGDSALAAPGVDVRALSDAVQRIVADPSLRRDLVERGRPRVRALTWERTAEAYERAYEDLVVESAARRPA